MIICYLAALVINSIETEEKHRISEGILLKIGHLFQMQDDFIDCFGDPTLTGKVGTDITDGKCCWPIVTAFQLCNEKQREVLNSNYGLKCEENVNAVKQIYEELNLIHVFDLKTTEMYDNICDEIQNLNNNHKLCPELYQYILDMIYKRNK